MPIEEIIAKIEINIEKKLQVAIKNLNLNDKLLIVRRKKRNRWKFFDFAPKNLELS